MSDTIECPKCGQGIEITEALSSQIKTDLRREVEAELEPTRLKLKKDQSRVRDEAEALDKRSTEIDGEVNRKLKEERQKIAEEAKQKARDEVSVELKDRDARETKLKEKLDAAEALELEWRQKERNLTERAEKIDLEVARKVDDERKKIRETTREQADEEHLLKIKEKDEALVSMRRKIDELKRKAEQGSQQSQGEAAEVDLEEMLKQAFPTDGIEPVQKGQRGADVLQVVRSSGGIECGRILWESKNTKNWSGKWTGKLREDQRNAKADVAVITSVVLPEEVTSFSLIDGVWVTSRPFVLPLASVLRSGLIELGQQRRSDEGKQDKMSLLYDYLMGSEFRQRIEAMVEAYDVMGTNLNREKAAMERLWREREKHIDIARSNVAGLFGDLKGIAGRSLESIETLDLPGATTALLSTED